MRGNQHAHTVPHANAPAASFVVCDKRSDINRVAVPAARIAQWRCDASAVCRFVAASLGLKQTAVPPTEDGLLPIGIASGNKRTQMLCLRVVQDHLTLVAGTDGLPLADVIGFESGRFTLDQEAVRHMVDAAPTADPRHTPSTVKREARKMDTRAMYATWQKAFQTLRKKHPGRSNVWYSQQIAKTDTGQGRDASTIKKHMLS